MKDAESGALFDAATVTLEPTVPGVPQLPLAYSV